LFFSDEIRDIDVAKAICATCALVKPCLEGAIARREPAGVWGGQLFADGEAIARKRKRGRPPKAATAFQGELVESSVCEEPGPDFPGGSGRQLPSAQLPSAQLKSA